MIKSALQWGGYLRNTDGCDSNEGHWNLGRDVISYVRYEGIGEILISKYQRGVINVSFVSLILTCFRSWNSWVWRNQRDHDLQVPMRSDCLLCQLYFRPAFYHRYSTVWYHISWCEPNEGMGENMISKYQGNSSMEMYKLYLVRMRNTFLFKEEHIVLCDTQMFKPSFFSSWLSPCFSALGILEMRNLGNHELQVPTRSNNLVLHKLVVVEMKEWKNHGLQYQRGVLYYSYWLKSEY